MKKIVFIISVVLAIGVSCKKKSNSEPVPTGPSATIQNAYSMIQTTKHTSDFHGTLIKDSSAMAVFYDKPMQYTTGSNYVSAGVVKINDSILPYYAGIYSSYHTPNITLPVRWSVSGSGTLTPFTQTITPDYPRYTGGNLLPDTCIKASGITVNVSGVSNTTQGVSLFLNGSMVSLNKFISNGGNGTVVFSASEIAGMNVNANVTLQLMMSNYNVQSHNGVMHNFVSTTSYQKQIWLK